MKKEYISPDIKVKAVEMERAMLAASTTGDPETDINNTPSTKSVNSGSILSKPNSIWDNDEESPF